MDILASFELLVGSGRFWERAKRDIAAAQRRVLVQAMTFEADAAGLGVAAALHASTAQDRRVLVDDFSRHVVSDHFVHSPSAPREVRDEAIETRRMFDALCQSDVAVRITNPIGRNPFRYAVRNHKKLIVADDVTYVGGINFSDHNFEWHDMMIRIEGAEETEFFVEDFEATWAGEPRAMQRRIGSADYFAFDGRDNATGFAPLFEMLANAKNSIEIVSAYPTFPFVDAFVAAAKRGVAVEVYTPWPNNKQIVRDYLLPTCAKSGIAVHLLPDMTHLKAILIDRQVLAVGSCNFDFVSHAVEEEYLVLLRDPDLIARFVAEVIEPGRKAALPQAGHEISSWQAAKAKVGLSVANALVKRLANVRRTAINWPKPS